jgi:hypothetical protein
LNVQIQSHQKIYVIIRFSNCVGGKSILNQKRKWYLLCFSSECNAPKDKFIHLSVFDVIESDNMQFVKKISQFLQYDFQLAVIVYYLSYYSLNVQIQSHQKIYVIIRFSNCVGGKSILNQKRKWYLLCSILLNAHLVTNAGQYLTAQLYSRFYES